MLRTFYGRDGVGDAVGESSLEGAQWIDLLEPTPDEIARVTERFDITLPSHEALSEIEASSRLRADGTRLIMSAPLIGRQGEAWVMVATGFILSAELLVTIRFGAVGAFDAVHERLSGAAHHAQPVEIMIQLLEEIVDRTADRLERAAEILAESSHDIFATPEAAHKHHKVGRETRRLQTLMVRIGRTNEELVRVRHSFVAIGRIAGFLLDRCQPRLTGPLRDRLRTAQHDIGSLDEFENSLAGRVSLLLDAAGNFISIEQNDVVRLLTVVSVAGVPPVLIAGIYGMNFKLMPELDWRMGYPLALALMVITTIAPVLWFKWRDWL